MARERSSPSVQSLDRALDLLEALGRLGEVRLGQLAEATAMYPSTVHRLLGRQHFVERRFVIQDDRSGRYRLGYAVLALAQDVARPTGELRALARTGITRRNQGRMRRDSQPRRAGKGTPPYALTRRRGLAGCE